MCNVVILLKKRDLMSQSQKSRQFCEKGRD